MRPSWKANPQVVQKLAAKRGEFNYDESKVPTFQLPDPLTMNDGRTVSDAATWTNTRRPELMDLFRHHVYGHRPTTDYSVEFTQVSQTEVLGGTAIGRELKATIKIDDRTFSFPFVVFIPTGVDHPVPAVVLINNRYFTPVKKVTEEYDSFIPVKDLIDRGYAVASFFTSDVDPDRADGYAEGIRSFFANGQPPTDDAWRSLSAWGFAASKVLDHLETLDTVDATKVAVVGHSRGGKTSLWAAAEDPRFAIGYSNHSGCGGAALSRRAFGETVARITSSFPHWFTPNYAKFAGRENELPVDQHELIGLIAPRGVYVASADEDLWADPRGEYLSLVESAPVFAVLGKQSIGQDVMKDPSLRSHVNPPALDTPLVVGQTGYHIGSGGHGLKHTDWKLFLDFADGLLK
ncbi:glucuronyl esterase domain-containing protein [Rubripirellula lacrimiformis]|nr:acetylxylan esterase [Rubripirellula lacrimiformis]